jgi:hypothetical protein
MKTVSLVALTLLAVGLNACANPSCPVPPPGSSTHSPHSAIHFFVRFTPPNTFPSSIVNGFVEMSTNGRFDRSGYDVNRSTWPDFYAYFQTVRDSYTFELKDFWQVPYLPSPTWGVFRISQSGNTYTLWRIHNQQQYVTVIVADSFAAIMDRLQMIYVNGTPEHREAINKLDILSYRIN